MRDISTNKFSEVKKRISIDKTQNDTCPQFMGKHYDMCFDKVMVVYYIILNW